MFIFSFLVINLFNKRFENILLNKNLFNKFSIRKIWWLFKRKRQISKYLNKNQIKKLQLGSGSNILSGWLNTDVVPQKEGVICLDSREVFPFKDKTLDYIFSEHQIEHVTYEEGLFILKECYRVLKVGGKIRIATPDLQRLIELYICKNKTEIQNNYTKLVVDFCYPTVGIYSDVFVLNSLFRNFGHKFIYDFKTLKTLLEKVGFVDISRFDISESSDINLQEIEGHGKLYETYGIQNGKELNKFETMVLEARKPI